MLVTKYCLHLCVLLVPIFKPDNFYWSFALNTCIVFKFGTKIRFYEWGVTYLCQLQLILWNPIPAEWLLNIIGVIYDRGSAQLMEYNIQ